MTRRSRRIRGAITAAFILYTLLATSGFLGLSAVPLDPPYAVLQKPLVLIALFGAMAVVPMFILVVVQRRTTEDEWPAADTDTVINVVSLLFSAGAINLVPAINWMLKVDFFSNFEKPDTTTGNIIVTCIAGALAVLALFRGLKAQAVNPPPPIRQSGSTAISVIAIVVTVFALFRGLKNDRRSSRSASRVKSEDVST